MGVQFSKVRLTFDPNKSAENDKLRGLPFEHAAEFDFTTTIIRQDTRKPYPEARYQALGMLGDKVCFLVFTPIPGGLRVISLRRAKRKERHRWQESQNPA
jgi:uncharacterized protein